MYNSVLHSYSFYGFKGENNFISRIYCYDNGELYSKLFVVMHGLSNCYSNWYKCQWFVHI